MSTSNHTAQLGKASGRLAASAARRAGRLVLVNAVDRQNGFEDSQAQADDFKPLTPQQAGQIRRQIKSVSVLWVLAVQTAVGIGVSLVLWGVSGRHSAAFSGFYGSLAVVVPAALFARGLRRQQAAAEGGSALVRFFVWELIKVGVTVAMLLLAPRLVFELSWPALLAGFVVTMKVYWLAMWLQLRQPARVD